MPKRLLGVGATSMLMTDSPLDMGRRFASAIRRADRDDGRQDQLTVDAALRHLHRKKSKDLRRRLDRINARSSEQAGHVVACLKLRGPAKQSGIS